MRKERYASWAKFPQDKNFKIEALTQLLTSMKELVDKLEKAIENNDVELSQRIKLEILELQRKVDNLL